MREKDLIQDDITEAKRKIDELEDEIVSSQFRLSKEEENKRALEIEKLKFEKDLEKLNLEFETV